ncbi:MAG TPA: cation-transporting ATPase [Cyclobacteriaceae bacterium]|nr:cation-transporting ATPase [Cyclobacteriaceae bacterium]
MKTILIITASFLTQLSIAQTKVVTDTIKVYGNCTMCKQRIETALDHKGIKQAKWDTKSKDLIVVFNSDKITEQQIHEIVASVGHDTDKVKAKDEVYSGLPFCCLYRDHDHSMKGNH